MSTYLVTLNSAREEVGIYVRAWGFDDAIKQAKEDFPTLRVAAVQEKRED